MNTEVKYKLNKNDNNSLVCFNNNSLVCFKMSCIRFLSSINVFKMFIQHMKVSSTSKTRVTKKESRKKIYPIKLFY